MIVLGIESTCDETAASLVEDGRRLLSNVISTSVKEQALYGGVVPEIASRRHCEFISATVKKALLDAGKTMDDVDAVAVTFAPGLIGAVLVGVNFAKGLAYSANKPLVPVHHLRGHIAALYLTHPELKPPFLCLVASGGHSHIVEVQDYTHYHILGHTVDDAAGEAFDKVARTLGLPYPGGPSVANAAKTGDPKAYRLPVPHVEGKYNVSFSGLKTAVLNEVNQAQMKGTEHLAVEHRTGNDDHTTLHMRVDGVPVDLLAVPVFLHLLAKQDLHGIGLMGRGHHQQVIVDVDLRLCQRHDHTVAAPDA